MNIRPDFLITVAVVTFVVMVGCAPKALQFEVKVDALRDPEAPEMRTYVVRPGLEGLDANDPQFKEFATYLDSALCDNGFRPAEEGGPVEMVIFLSYGVGEPRTTTESTAAYGSVSGRTAPGVVSTRTVDRTEYPRWVVVEAVDADAFVKTHQFVELWRTAMTSSGSSGDLRLVFPIMVAAGKSYIATSTGRPVSCMLTENSPEVLKVRGQKP